MRILHIAHYDEYPRSNQTFVGNPRNGLSRWIESMITQTSGMLEHYVMFFNEFDKTIFVQKVNEDGCGTIYTYYAIEDYNEEALVNVFKNLLLDIPFDLIHIHYLQEYVKYIPSLLSKLDFENVIATMHDESFLGSIYGFENNYVYDVNVANFFRHLKKVIFIHNVSKERYFSLYADVLKDKTIVIPNGITIDPIAQYNNTNEKFKIVVLGTINEYKGFNIVKRLSDLLEVEESNIVLISLGKLEHQLSNVVEYGRYNAQNLSEKMLEINPDCILLPSIVEETFPYTALEATGMGYPIICFNVGALQDIEGEKRGFVVKEKTGEEVFLRIKELAEMKKVNPELWQSKLKEVSEFPVFSELEMSKEYLNVYTDFSRKTENISINYENLFKRNLSFQKATEKKFYDTSLFMETYRKQYHDEATKAYGIMQERDQYKIALEKKQIFRRIGNKFRRLFGNKDVNNDKEN